MRAARNRVRPIRDADNYDVEIRSYVPRDAFIVDRCRGKRVLHLGCLGETCGKPGARERSFRAPASLHSRLLAAAKEVVGVDLDSQALRRLTQAGYPGLFAGDVERLEELDLPSWDYDVVVAGDIIEHLSNPGAMLTGLRALAPPHAELVVTTPNAYGLPNYIRYARGKFRDGPDHVQSYTVFTLTHLLNRHGWRVDQALSCYQARASRQVSTVAFRLGRWLFQRIPRLGGTLLLVCLPADEGSR